MTINRQHDGMNSKFFLEKAVQQMASKLIRSYVNNLEINAINFLANGSLNG